MSHLRRADSSQMLEASRVARCSATASPKSAAHAQPSQSVHSSVKSRCAASNAVFFNSGVDIRQQPPCVGWERLAASASSSSSVSSRSSIRSPLPVVLIASSYIVTSFGQDTTKKSSSPSPTASRMRFSEGRSAPGVSGIQIRPPPAPQQNELSRLRGISTSVQPSRSRIARGAS